MKISHLLACMVLSSVCVLVAQFVVQPKKKAPSAAKIKELCAEELADQLELCACLVESVGKLERTLLAHMRALLNNDKEYALNQKKQDELQLLHTKICMINESLRTMKQQLQEYDPLIRCS